MAKRPTPEGAASAPAPIKRAPAVNTDTDEREVRNRRHFGRGWLAEAIDQIFRRVEKGETVADAPLTVSAIRNLVANSQGEQPSTGAVSAVLDRWSKGGYIKVTGKPVAFNGFPSRWSADKGGSLTAFLEADKTKRKRLRQAERETVEASV